MLTPAQIEIDGVAHDVKPLPLRPAAMQLFAAMQQVERIELPRFCQHYRDVFREKLGDMLANEAPFFRECSVKRDMGNGIYEIEKYRDDVITLRYVHIFERK